MANVRFAHRVSCAGGKTDAITRTDLHNPQQCTSTQFLTLTSCFLTTIGAKSDSESKLTMDVLLRALIDIEKRLRQLEDGGQGQFESPAHPHGIPAPGNQNRKEPQTIPKWHGRRRLTY
jgi:hypothetical protein